MNDELRRATRSVEEAKMMREVQARELKAARELGLRGKAFGDFAASIGVDRARAFRMVRGDYPDRGFGKREG